MFCQSVFVSMCVCVCVVVDVAKIVKTLALKHFMQNWFAFFGIRRVRLQPK